MVYVNFATSQIICNEYTSVIYITQLYNDKHRLGGRIDFDGDFDDRIDDDDFKSISRWT